MSCLLVVAGFRGNVAHESSIKYTRTMLVDGDDSAAPAMAELGEDGDDGEEAEDTFETIEGSSEAKPSAPVERRDDQGIETAAARKEENTGGAAWDAISDDVKGDDVYEVAIIPAVGLVGGAGYGNIVLCDPATITILGVG